jgi:hypothetical protein
MKGKAFKSLRAQNILITKRLKIYFVCVGDCGFCPTL